MIVVIVNHWCKEGKFDDAVRRIDANGDSSAQAPGFLFRYRLGKDAEPDRLTTVSGWTSLEDYRNWKDERTVYDAAHPEESPYRDAVNEVFVVAKSHPGPLSGALPG